MKHIKRSYILTILLLTVTWCALDFVTGGGKSRKNDTYKNSHRIEEVLSAWTVFLSRGHTGDDNEIFYFMERQTFSKFSRYTLVSPIIYHGKQKREIKTIKDEGALNHPDHLTIVLPVDNKTLTLDLILSKELIPKNFFREVQEHGINKIIEPTTEQLCQYRGQVRHKPDSWVALSTCDGLSGVIYDGSQIHRIEKKKVGSDIVHFLYKLSNRKENRTRGYLNEPNRFKRAAQKKNKLIGGPYNENSESRYLELILVIAKDKYNDLKNNSESVETYCKDLVNIMNGIFSSLNIFVALVGVVIWTERDEIEMNKDIRITLKNFGRYRREQLLQKHPHDNAFLIRKTPFDSVSVGFVKSMCTSEYSCGVTMDSPAVALDATRISHEIGHNLGLLHDGYKNCKCRDENCIMHPYSMTEVLTEWSSCSLNYLKSAYEQGLDHCLKNKPTSLFQGPVCGNGFVEDGEQCDCGLASLCNNNCCNATTCMLNGNAKCATGECCDLTSCQLKPPGVLCRFANNDCDLPEYCNGQIEYCPADVYRMDTEVCENEKGYCYQGHCRTRSEQCRLIWKKKGQVADNLCYKMNTKGTQEGNCGYNIVNQTYVKCEEPDIFCGRLHCTHTLSPEIDPYGSHLATVISTSFLNSTTPCTTATIDLGLDLLDPGMVPDGTKCGEGKMCLNQKCLPLSTILANRTCPNNCYNNGWCNSLGHCHCKAGYAQPHCQHICPGGSMDSGPAYSYRNNLD